MTTINTQNRIGIANRTPADLGGPISHSAASKLLGRAALLPHYAASARLIHWRCGGKEGSA